MLSILASGNDPIGQCVCIHSHVYFETIKNGNTAHCMIFAYDSLSHMETDKSCTPDLLPLSEPKAIFSYSGGKEEGDCHTESHSAAVDTVQEQGWSVVVRKQAFEKRQRECVPFKHTISRLYVYL